MEKLMKYRNHFSGNFVKFSVQYFGTKGLLEYWSRIFLKFSEQYLEKIVRNSKKNTKIFTKIVGKLKKYRAHFLGKFAKFSGQCFEKLKDY